jgi:hypothetical protein
VPRSSGSVADNTTGKNDNPKETNDMETNDNDAATERDIAEAVIRAGGMLRPEDAHLVVEQPHTLERVDAADLEAAEKMIALHGSAQRMTRSAYERQKEARAELVAATIRYDSACEKHSDDSLDTLLDAEAAYVEAYIAHADALDLLMGVEDTFNIERVA